MAAVGGAEISTAVAQVISLQARRQLLSRAARQAAAEITKRAAGMVLVSAGMELLEIPPEAVGLAIETGMDIGVAAASTPGL